MEAGEAGDGVAGQGEDVGFPGVDGVAAEPEGFAGALSDPLEGFADTCGFERFGEKIAFPFRYAAGEDDYV